MKERPFGFDNFAEAVAVLSFDPFA